MGYIGSPPDRVNVSGIAKEIFPKQGWSSYADSRKILQIVRAEQNISLFLNTRATGVEMASTNTIRAVLALDVRIGQRMSFSAPRFVDCTGHGWIGYYAGAEYRMGQEARAEFGESLAPVQPGRRTMGNSLYKAVIRDHRYPSVPGTAVRYDDRESVKLEGDWRHSTFQGGDYVHDNDENKGAMQAVFSMSVDKPGRYAVFLGYMAFSNRASNVPITVALADGETSLVVEG